MPTSEEAVVRFIAQLNGLLPALEPDLAPEGDPTPEKWAYLIDRVKTSTTRFTLISRDRPSYEDTLPMADLLYENVARFVALYQLIYLNSSNTLQNQLKSLMEEFLQALIALGEGIIEENSLSKQSKPPGMTSKDKANNVADRRYGQVEQCLQALSTTPLDDYRATATTLEKANKLIRDALKELEECLAAPSLPEEDTNDTSDTKPDEDNSDGGDDDRDFWDLDEEDDLGLTEKQKEVLPPCITLIKVSGGAILAISKALKSAYPQKHQALQCVNDENHLSMTEKFDLICQKTHEIQHVVDDLACGIYPPQDRQILLERAETLCTLTNDLITLCAEEEVPEEIKSRVSKLSMVANSLSTSALSQLRSFQGNS